MPNTIAKNNPENGKHLVLVVEDEEINREILAEILSGEYDVICAECGQPTQVPFQPRGDRPVYCRACFEKMRAENDRW